MSETTTDLPTSDRRAALYHEALIELGVLDRLPTFREANEAIELATDWFYAR